MKTCQYYMTYNVWQKSLQYCKVISFQLIKINEKKLHDIENNNHNAKVRGSCREGTIKVTNILSDTETQASLPPWAILYLQKILTANFDFFYIPCCWRRAFQEHFRIKGFGTISAKAILFALHLGRVNIFRCSTFSQTKKFIFTKALKGLGDRQTQIPSLPFPSCRPMLPCSKLPQMSLIIFLN